MSTRAELRRAGQIGSRAEIEANALEVALAGKAAASHTHVQSDVAGLAAALATVPAASSATPAQEGTGAAGSASAYARGDHVHPSPAAGTPTGQSPSGSPWVYQNTSARREMILISAGTVTAIELSVNGSDYYGAGLLSGAYLLALGMYCRITYILAPAVTTIAC